MFRSRRRSPEPPPRDGVFRSEFGLAPDRSWTKLNDVPVRVSSSRFVGRRAELTRLEERWKAAVADERAATVLVAGEAGVGKSRLVAELVDRIPEPALVLVGQCFDLVDRAFPFGPIVQVLRELHRSLDDETLAAVVGPGRDELAALLPELHTPAREGIVAGALFEQLLGVFERLTERVPTLLVLEDLHWADRSTRELFVYLARSLRTASMVLVGTYRSDDLHRRHPLRGLLVELDRSGAVERIDLERFDRDEVRELIRAIVGSEPSVELVEQTYRRSDGNIFFAEELLAVNDECDTSIPPTLREIVLARVDGLSDPAQQVLRCAAVIGRSVDHRLLEAAAGLAPAELQAGVREAVAQHILVTEGDGMEYRFRHALVREAVEDDLLPGDRVALHTRVAEELGIHPEWFDGGSAQLFAQLACHWDSARDAPRALVASLDAARAAERIYAYGDALEHAEQILTLWSQVPDAEARTGMNHVDMMRYTATQAEMSGSTDRALDYIRSALSEIDPAADPVVVGLLHERLGRYLWMLSRSWADILEHCREAVRLVPEEPSAARAKVLATLGQQLMLAGEREETIAVCEQAIAVAQAVGERVIEGHAHNSLGSALAGMGRTDDGLAELHCARELAIEAESWMDVARAAVNEGGALQTLARHEEALAISLDGAEVARAHGLDRAFGAFLRLNAAEILHVLGRWDEADEQLREVESLDPLGIDAWRLSEQECMLAVGRAQFDTARAKAARVVELIGPAGGVRDHLSTELLQIAIAAWSGDEAGALEVAVAALRVPAVDLRLCGDVSLEVILEGLAAGASLAARTRDPQARATYADQVQELAGELERAIATDRWGGGRPGALDTMRAHVAAETKRAAAADDGPGWLAVAELWSTYRMRPREAYARMRAAEAFVRDDDRDAAAASAREAYARADAIGWICVRDSIMSLARRARLDLGPAGNAVSSPADRYGLTTRELDVLALVAEGCTNRQIGDALFISAKTASVHVSNILAKLGVANRGEAAAAARRLGLDLPLAPTP
jgi:DNA-binding CsgD family transcriptional regulator/tetratricopeptide (TPR) repeat protein